MRIIRIILIISLLLLPGPSPSNAQSNPSPDSKISALLAHQISLKIEATGSTSPGKTLKTLDATGANTADLQSQLVFLHFKALPDSQQITELQNLGITVYPDSWIPPVGIHPYGFVLARIPVSKVRTMAEKPYIMKMNTAETVLKPYNDLAAQKISATSVWTSGYNGSGIKVAVIDSGLELNHPDIIPASVAYKDYSVSPPDNTVNNTVTGHGTHVAGSVLGRGTNSSGKYKGIAPGADLIFLKVGRDGDGVITTSTVTNAIRDAVDVYGANIINLSLGSWKSYQDGTSETDQAVDYAFSRGAVVFAAAGNEADEGQHYSGTVLAGTTTLPIQVNITGSNGSNAVLQFNLIWFDGTGTHNILNLLYFNSSGTQLTSPAPTYFPQSESVRGTEHQLSYYSQPVPSGNQTYYLKVQNTSASTQSFHIYFEGLTSGGAKVRFQNPDPNYTTGSPANADGAIAVGAYVTRGSWTDYKENGPWWFGETLNTLATFSSRGPRIDTGAPPKPSIIAPGSAIISLRDRDVYTFGPDNNPIIIDNDGLNLGANNTGPADYFIMEGTSMASPVAAGAAALLLQAKPSLKGNPAAVRSILQQTAENYGIYSRDTGYGMLNIQAALSYANNEPIPPTIAWVRQFGTPALDSARGLAIDNSGNLYVTGYTSGAFTGLNNSGGKDIFLRKYDTSGNESWTRQFGTSANEEAYATAVDSSGNIYVTGFTLGNLSGQGSSGGEDVFLRKYNSTGNELWTRQFGTSNNEWGRSVATDSSGNAYVAGYTWGTLPSQSSSGSRDAFIKKYDSTGSAAWTRQFGTSGEDSARSLAIDGTGNVYVSGYTYGTLPNQASSGGQDAFLRKYDSSGNEIWTRQFGTSGNDLAYSLALDVSGSIYIAGYTSAAFTGNSNLGWWDAFLRKYDTSGNELWTRQFGSSMNDYVYDMATDSAGNIYITGQTYGAFPGMTSSGGSDSFLRVYNATGSVAWTRQFGSLQYDFTWSLVTDTIGDSYLVGYTEGALPGQAYHGAGDAFIIKFNKYTAPDTLSPGPVGNLMSPTHATATWSKINIVTVTWTPSVDLGGSGLDGYSILWDQSPNAMASATKVIEETATSAFSAALTSTNTWYFHIRPVDNNGNWGSTQHLGPFKIDTISPPAPILSYPSSGATVSAVSVTFSWGAVSDMSGVSYKLQVATTASFSNPLINQENITNTAYTTAGPFNEGPHYWRVKAIDGAGNDSPYATSSFTVIVGTDIYPPAIPSLLSPSNGITLTTSTPIFTWSAVTDTSPPVLYDFRVATNSTMTAVIISKTNLTTNTYTLTGSEALANGTYWWQVRARDSATPTFNYSGWSPTWNLTIGSPPPIAWIRQFGSGDGSYAYSISLDSSRNIYTAGFTNGVLPGGGGSSGSADAFLRKYDSNGNEVWTRQFGSSFVDKAYSVALDSSGNIYVAGQTYIPAGGGSYAQAAFLRKYDTSGNEIWTRQFESTSTAHGAWAESVTLDSTGNIYIAGYTFGVVSGGGGSSGDMDAFLRRYDGNGNEIWTRQFGTSNGDFAFSVSVDSAGNIYVAGVTSGALPGGGGTSGSSDAFLRKYDSNGIEVWTRQFGTPRPDDARSVSADSSGNIYVAGVTDEAALPGGGGSSGGSDTFLRKYNSNGNEIWTRQFGSSGSDLTTSVSVDSSGNIYVTGQTWGVLPGGGGNSGMSDGFLTKFDSSGNAAWTAQFGSSTGDSAESVVLDSSGNIYVAGWTSGNVNRAQSVSLGGSGNMYMTGQTSGTLSTVGVSSGGDDAFIIKFTQAGAVQPGVPTLLSPPDSSVLNSLPTLDWSDVAGSGITYNLVVDDSSDFSSPVLNISNIISSTYTISSNLKASTTYFWKVRAQEGAGNSGGFSTARSFTLNKTTATTAWTEGWNMISLPLSPDAATIGYQLSELGNSIILYNYNTADRQYSIYTSAASMSIGVGYWIKIQGNVSVSFEGVPTGAGGVFTIPINAGWNQIGYPFISSLPLSAVRVRYQGQEVTLATASANGWVTSIFYEYSTTDRQYTMPSQLNPFKGYWVKSNVAAELLIPPPQ